MSQLQASLRENVKSAPVPGYFALAAGLLVIGGSPVLVRAAGAPGPVSGFYRLGIGWIGLSILLALRRRRLKVSTKGFRWAAIAGWFFGMDLVFWASGIMLSGPTKPTLLSNTTPIWVGLGAMLFYRERHRPLFWVSLLIAFSGIALVLGDDLIQSPELGLGSLFGLISALFYSGFFLAAQRGRAHLDALSFAWGFTLVSALVLLASTVILKQDLTGYDRQTILIFILMGVVIQVCGWLLITYAQGHLPASIVSPTLLGQPVLTGIFSVLIFGETFSAWELFGALMVLGGVFLVHVSKRRRRE